MSDKPSSSTAGTHAALTATALAASLTVKDLAASVAWYRDVLGFEVTKEYEREGRVLSVSVRAGSVELLFNQDDGARGMDRTKGEGVSLMITTADDVDAIAGRITAQGGTLISPPTDMPWGARVFRVADPDGYRLAISTPR